MPARSEEVVRSPGTEFSNKRLSRQGTDPGPICSLPLMYSVLNPLNPSGAACTCMEAGPSPEPGTLFLIFVYRQVTVAGGLCSVVCCF